MDDDLILRVLAEQRKRLVAAIMQQAESTCWDKMTHQERQEFRTKVIGSINVFYDLMRDVIKVNRDDFIRSEEAVALIRQVHDSQARVERSLAVADG